MKALPLLALAALFAAGCGSSASGDKPVSIASDQQVEDMVAARKIFEGSADKNYETLPAGQKTQYNKLVHATDDSGARHWWDTMKNLSGSTGGSSNADKTMGR